MIPDVSTRKSFTVRFTFKASPAALFICKSPSVTGLVPPILWADVPLATSVALGSDTLPLLISAPQKLSVQ